MEGENMFIRPGGIFFGFDVLIVYVFGIVRTEQDDRT